MCAVNGFTFNDLALVRKMNAATRHRGPDGAGIFNAEGISLGHNRLSIVDTSERAAQPMKSHDGRLVISFNGEIYNFKELRASLSPDYPFKTDSDTEVLLAAYVRWGPDCLSRINGIFAFALWDTDKQELFLARDAMGVKPLYYFRSSGGIIFSSEIKGILAHGISRAINMDAFDMYMRGGYVPAPLTMFEGVLKFPAGHYARYRNGVFTIMPFAHTAPFPLEGAGLVTPDILAGALDSAVRRQLAADRPVGVYLSGGIDSSIILDSAARFLSQPPRTFSTGFALDATEDPEKFNADAVIARRTAAWYGSTHYAIECTPHDVIPLLHAGAWHLDEPVANPTMIPMLCLARAARSTGTPVVLTGDGGDELFGGYARYRMSRRIGLLRALPPFFRPSAVRHASSAFDHFLLFMSNKDKAVNEVVRAGIMSGAHRNFFFNIFNGNFVAGRTIERTLMDVDRCTWLVDEALLRVDKAAMAHGIEARVPFLDPSVVALADRLERNQAVGLFRTKILLKKAFADRLPPPVRIQQKRGWFAPAAKWMRVPAIRAHMGAMLSPDYSPATRDLFRWNSLSRMLEDHADKKRYNATMLWTVIAFQAWACAFLNSTAYTDA